MATARNRNVKVSPPVEEKVVETPQVEEVKEAPKPVEVKPVEAPKEEENVKIQKKDFKVNPNIKTGSLVKSLDGNRGTVIEIISLGETIDNDVLAVMYNKKITHYTRNKLYLESK